MYTHVHTHTLTHTHIHAHSHTYTHIHTHTHTHTVHTRGFEAFGSAIVCNIIIINCAIWPNEKTMQ